MRLAKPQQNAQTFLIQLWKMERDGNIIWKARMVCLDTDEVFAFSDLDSMYTFLKDKSATESHNNAKTPSPTALN